MINRLPLVVLTAALALGACTQGRPAERGPVAPAARITGDPQTCIPLTQVSETKIRDDWTIDFISSGRRAWRNSLPQRCSGLKFADAFSHETSLSQYCSTDIIRVLEHSGGRLERGSGCGLGQFVPVELDK